MILLAQADARALPLADGSVQCCVTSPPYWGLRDYGSPGQLGLEATPEEYVDGMVEVFREVRRTLRPDGVLWLNLGDSYITAPHGSGSTHDPKWPGGRDRAVDRANRASFRRDRVSCVASAHVSHATLKPKDMVGIPWRVAFALQADGWWLRSDIIWHKPNPMPESVTDRPTKAHEYMFLLSKSAQYFYDADAVKEPVTVTAHSRGHGVNLKAKAGGQIPRVKQNPSFSAAVADLVDERNLRSVWTITTQPFKGSHYATFPERLVEPCIRAGSREGDTVLDPFAGTATVGRVALSLKRYAACCDISDAYLRELATRRTSNVQMELGGLR